MDVFLSLHQDLTPGILYTCLQFPSQVVQLDNNAFLVKTHAGFKQALLLCLDQSYHVYTREPLGEEGALYVDVYEVEPSLGLLVFEPQRLAGISKQRYSIC